jgi:hypothetical protein
VPTAGIITIEATTDQKSAMTKAAANGTKAARELPWRYRKGNSTTAVVSVDPATAGKMRAPAAARASGSFGTPRRRSTTMRPFCTRIPTPMPSPARVSRLAGIRSR